MGFVVGDVDVGLVSAGLMSCSFVGVLAFRVFCWQSSSSVLYMNWGFHIFVKGVTINFVCCIDILISLLSSF